jgi:predicted TIM-barrel fold metal-dependent hydrolase
MKEKIGINIPKCELFDFHRHIGFRMENFEANLSKYNINQFCLMPTVFNNDFKNITQYIEKLQPYFKKYSDRSIIFGCLDFTKSVEENLNLLEKQKITLDIKGIKIHPFQPFKLKRYFLKPYFDLVFELFGPFPIYIHMDWPLSKENGFAPRGKKKTFNKFPSFFPEFKFVMGHAGGSGDYLKIWKTCKKYPNVYIETSMAPTTATLEEVIWKIGPNRLLFGSNYPFCGTDVEVMRIQALHKVTEHQKKQILSENWREVLNI